MLTPELLQVIEGLALEKPPRSAAAVYREVYELAQQQGRKPLTLASAAARSAGRCMPLLRRS